MKNNPGRAAKYVAKIAGASVSLGLLGILLGGSDDDGESAYFSIPQETRNTNMVFMLPGLDGGLKIPLPYNYGFFWAMGQEVLAATLGRRGAGATVVGIMGSFLNNFNPLESAASLEHSHGWWRMISPTVTDPLFDIGYERTPFGTPLMPEKVYEDQPDSARHWRSVSGVSKAIAKWVNDIGGSEGVPGYISVSPETLDLLFEQVTGGTGRFITRTLSLAMSPVTDKEVGANDIPILRRFAAGGEKWSDRNKFQENYEEIHGVVRTMKSLKDNVNLAKIPSLKTEAQADLQDFISENKPILSMRDAVNQAYTRSKAVDERKKALYKSGLDSSEYADKLRALDEQQRLIFVNFNRRFSEARGSK